MKKIIYLCACLAITVVTSTVYAQQNGQWKMQLNYSASTPSGSFKNDVINKTSFNGANAEIAYWFNPSFSLGGATGFQDYYYKRDRQLYSLGKNETISAVLSNSVQAIPILAKGTYAPPIASPGFLKPYVSLGAGINLVQHRQYLGEFTSLNDAAVSFAAQAGAGVMIPFGKTENFRGLNLGANYNYVPYNKNGINNLNNWGFNAGIIFPLK